MSTKRRCKSTHPDHGRCELRKHERGTDHRVWRRKDAASWPNDPPCTCAKIEASWVSLRSWERPQPRRCPSHGPRTPSRPEPPRPPSPRRPENRQVLPLESNMDLLIEKAEVEQESAADRAVMGDHIFRLDEEASRTPRRVRSRRGNSSSLHTLMMMTFALSVDAPPMPDEEDL